MCIYDVIFVTQDQSQESLWAKAIPTRGNVRQCRNDADALNFRQTPTNHALPAGSRYCTLGGVYDPGDRQNRGGRGTYLSEWERSVGASAARPPGGVWYLPRFLVLIPPWTLPLFLAL